MSDNRTFSERHGLAPATAPISIRREAPARLRELGVRLAYETELTPSDLRRMLCDLLLEVPDPSNWSDFPNIDAEVHGLLARAEWYQVYEFIELIGRDLQKRCDSASYIGQLDARRQSLERFVARLNEVFRRSGIGWRLVDGRVEIRGEEAFESSVRTVIEVTKETGRSVAEHELHEALHDLSKRPNPDITGAIQHAMAALECAARDITANPKPTLGELVKKNPNLFPSPLDQMVDKLWGFTSEQGRHLREGRAPNAAEAELVVGLAGTLVTYLVRKAEPQCK